MRLGTFNLMHGRSLSDGLVVPRRLHDSIAVLDADVLGLQEVDRGQPRSCYADLAAAAADALGARYHRFVPALLGTPGGAYRAADGSGGALDGGAPHGDAPHGDAPHGDAPHGDGGAPHGDAPHGDGGAPATTGPEYGIALLSRWPVLEWRMAYLPAAPVRSPIYVPGRGGGLLLLADEPRVVLAAVIDTPRGTMTVATTHLSFVPGWNIRQLRSALKFLRGLPAPRVLMGDLNLPSAVVGPVTGWLRLARQPTYPSSAPRIQFDHVLADRRGSAALPTVKVAQTPPVTVSDHRPLMVQLA